MTGQLFDKGYLVSLNVPVWGEVYNLMDYESAARTNESIFFNWTDNRRNWISVRDLPKVEKFSDFQHYLRYNDFEKDPYSVVNGLKDPTAAIAARGDLGDSSKFAWDHMMGALDAKACRLSDVWDMLRFSLVNSPTVENQPPFNFSDLQNVSFDGLPAFWNYSWIVFKDDAREEVCGRKNKLNDCVAEKFCGWCSDGGRCLVGTTAGPVYGGCSYGWTFEVINDNSLAISGAVIGTIAVLSITLAVAIIYIQKRDANRIDVEPLYSQPLIGESLA
jgi:hypothetical protein